MATSCTPCSQPSSSSLSLSISVLAACLFFPTAVPKYLCSSRLQRMSHFHELLYLLDSEQGMLYLPRSLHKASEIIRMHNIAGQRNWHNPYSIKNLSLTATSKFSCQRQMQQKGGGVGTMEVPEDSVRYSCGPSTASQTAKRAADPYGLHADNLTSISTHSSVKFQCQSSPRKGFSWCNQ